MRACQKWPPRLRKDASQPSASFKSQRLLNDRLSKKTLASSSFIVFHVEPDAEGGGSLLDWLSAKHGNK